MFDEARPIYLQIADQVRTDILRGDLGPDDRVMSTTQIAREFRINPATAAKGLSLLVDDGILYKRRGVGMFVHADAPERLLDRRRAAFFRDRVDAVVVEAQLLDIPLEAVVDHIRATAPAQPRTRPRTRAQAQTPDQTPDQTETPTEVQARTQPRTHDLTSQP